MLYNPPVQYSFSSASSACQDSRGTGGNIYCQTFSFRQRERAGGLLVDSSMAGLTCLGDLGSTDGKDTKLPSKMHVTKIRTLVQLILQLCKVSGFEGFVF